MPFFIEPIFGSPEFGVPAGTVGFGVELVTFLFEFAFLNCVVVRFAAAAAAACCPALVLGNRAATPKTLSAARSNPSKPQQTEALITGTTLTVNRDASYRETCTLSTDRRHMRTRPGPPMHGGSVRGTFSGCGRRVCARPATDGRGETFT
ncbi:hypothetical protein CBL_03522 [Carabus blaptoides fortunei]